MFSGKGIAWLVLNPGSLVPYTAKPIKIQTNTIICE